MLELFNRKVFNRFLIEIKNRKSKNELIDLLILGSVEWNFKATFKSLGLADPAEFVAFANLEETNFYDDGCKTQKPNDHGFALDLQLDQKFSTFTPPSIGGSCHNHA